MRSQLLNLSTVIVILALAVDVVAATWLHGRPGAASGSTALAELRRGELHAATPHTGGPLGKSHDLTGDPEIDQHPGHAGVLWDERLWLVAFAGIALTISLIICGGTCRVLRRDQTSAR